MINYRGNNQQYQLDLFIYDLVMANMARNNQKIMMANGR